MGKSPGRSNLLLPFEICNSALKMIFKFFPKGTKSNDLLFSFSHCSHFVNTNDLCTSLRCRGNVQGVGERRRPSIPRLRIHPRSLSPSPSSQEPMAPAQVKCTNMTNLYRELRKFLNIVFQELQVMRSRAGLFKARLS